MNFYKNKYKYFIFYLKYLNIDIWSTFDSILKISFKKKVCILRRYIGQFFNWISGSLKKILPRKKRRRKNWLESVQGCARVLLSSKHDASRVLFKTVVVRRATVALRTSLTYTVRICISLPCFVHEYTRVVWKHDESVRGTIMCTKSDTGVQEPIKKCRLYFPRSPFVRDVREPRFPAAFFWECVVSFLPVKAPWNDYFRFGFLDVFCFAIYSEWMEFVRGIRTVKLGWYEFVGGWYCFFASTKFQYFKYLKKKIMFQ